MAEMVKSFRNLFNIISKNIVVILVATVLCMVISYSIRTLVMKDTYNSTTALLVTRNEERNNNIGYGDVQADTALITTYKDNALQKSVLNQVSKQMINSEENWTSGRVYDAINVTSNKGSQVFRITAKAASPNEAQRLASVFAEVAKNKVEKSLDVDNIKIISKADKNTQSTLPNKKILLLAGAMVGLVIGIGIGYIKSVLAEG